MNQLPFGCTKDDIRGMFEQAGCAVASCRIVLKAGKFTGVAFVDLVDSESVEKGLSLHRSSFNGRTINVRPTVPPTELSRIAAARQRHVAALPRPACYAFLNGSCTRGAGCKFSHEQGAPTSQKQAAVARKVAEEQQAGGESKRAKPGKGKKRDKESEESGTQPKKKLKKAKKKDKAAATPAERDSAGPRALLKKVKKKLKKKQQDPASNL